MDTSGITWMSTPTALTRSMRPGPAFGSGGMARCQQVLGNPPTRTGARGDGAV
jgi:ammonia channel protein AmtB